MEDKSKRIVKPTKETNYLTQILINVMVLGIFLLIEAWLLFFMLSDSFVLPMIFGILIILSGCLLTINLYQLFISRTNQGVSSSEEEKKLHLYIVRQLKQQEKRLDEMEEALRKNQLLATKAVIKSMEEVVTQAMNSQNQMQQIKNNQGQDIEVESVDEEFAEDSDQLLEGSNVSDALNLLSEGEDYDPNKQLTADEIAAMFANV